MTIKDVYPNVQFLFCILLTSSFLLSCYYRKRWCIHWGKRSNVQREIGRLDILLLSEFVSTKHSYVFSATGGILMSNGKNLVTIAFQCLQGKLQKAASSLERHIISKVICELGRDGYDDLADTFMSAAVRNQHNTSE